MILIVTTDIILNITVVTMCMRKFQTARSRTNTVLGGLTDDESDKEEPTYPVPSVGEYQRYMYHNTYVQK